MSKIISISGRLSSGKTALANVCIEEGFKRLSFATPLKDICCKLLGFESIEKLNSFKTKQIGVDVDLNKLSELVDIPVDFVREKCKSLNKESTGRDVLQVIGTNLLRTYEPDWHVKRTIKIIQDNPNINYVFDDTRFPNELKALRYIGAECIFIIRLKTDNISNHISETALSYQDFPNSVIFNQSNDLEFFTTPFISYVKCVLGTNTKYDDSIVAIYREKYNSLYNARQLDYWPELGLLEALPTSDGRFIQATIKPSSTAITKVYKNPFDVEYLKQFVN